MQQVLDEQAEKYPTKSSFEIAQREELKALEGLLSARNSKTLFEREYYFDEGLGQSLNEHTKELKEKLPGALI